MGLILIVMGVHFLSSVLNILADVEFFHNMSLKNVRFQGEI